MRWTQGPVLALLIVVAGCGQGRMAPEEPAPAAPVMLGEGGLVRLNKSIEEYWIHPGGPQAGPHSITGKYFRDHQGHMVRPGDALPEELARFRDQGPELTQALLAILDAGADQALSSRRPVLTSDWPGPALWRRVEQSRVLLLIAMVEGRWQEFRRMAHALFVLGSIVARGREGDGRPERMVHLRIGMEVQLAALHAIHRADAEGWMSAQADRAAMGQLLQGWLRIRVPWHVFEDPARAEAASWFGATTSVPQGAAILHRVGAYREVLLHGLAHASGLPRGQVPEAWPGGKAQDPLAAPGTNLGMRHEPGAWLRIWSVGLDGRDDGGDPEKDFVLYPYPADGWYRRPVPGL